MNNVNYFIWAYLVYLVVTIPLIAWVGSALFKNGKIFILDIFKGNTELTDAINKLLLIGFYLVNVGYAVYTLRIMSDIETIKQLFDVLSKKIGFIVLLLGFMHFLNMTVLYKLRKRALYWNNHV